jgi:hypothetical protein
MDNVFEILIYAIIIISFLSSFFKKKQKEVPQKGEESERDNVEISSIPKPEPMVQQKKEVDDYDILREIEKMFKVETPSPPIPAPKKIEPARRTEPVIKTDIRKVSAENAPTQSEHAFSKSITYDGQYSKPTPKVKSVAREEKHYVITKPVVNPYLDLKRKLKDPQTVRDFIVISEIIGKPKALRR